MQEAEARIWELEARSLAGRRFLVDFLSVFKGKKGMVRIAEAERSRSRVGVDCGDGARHYKGFDRSTFCR